MQYRLNELKHSICQKFNLTFIIIFLGVISVSLCVLSIAIYYKINSQNEKYENKYEKVQYYKTADNFTGEAEQKFSSDPERFIKLKKYNEKMNGCGQFTYLETYTQLIYFKDYGGSDVNLSGYEEGDYERSKNRIIPSADGSEEIYSSVNCFWIGSNIIDYFDIRLSEGAAFEEEDYIWREEKPVKILLGAEYKDNYNVGDTVQLNIIIAQTEAVVVGFLDEGTNVEFRNQLLNLDRYVILPQFQIPEMPQTSEQKFAFWVLYLMKNCGTVATNLEPNDVQDIVINYCEELNIFPAYYVGAATNQQSITFGMNMNTILDIIRGVAIGILLFSSIIFTIYMYMRVRNNGRYYAILLMNGFSYRDILWIVMGEILFILFMTAIGGSVLGIALSYLFGESHITVWHVLLPTMLSGVLPSIIAMKKLMSVDLCVFLRRK